MVTRWKYLPVETRHVGRGLACLALAWLFGWALLPATQAQLVGGGASGGGTAPLDMKYIPTESMAAGWAKPGVLLQNPEIKKLAAMFEDAIGMKKSVGVGFAEIESARVAMMMNPTKRDPTQPGYYRQEWPMFSLRFNDAAATQSYLTTFLKGYKPAPNIGNLKAYSRFWGQEGVEPTEDQIKRAPTYVTPDDRTVVYGEMAVIMPYIPDLAGPAKNKPAWAEHFAKIAAQPAGGFVDLKQVRAMVKEQMGDRRPTGMEGMVFNSFATLWEQADFAVGTLNVSDGIQANAFAICPDEKAAKRVEGTVKGLLSLAKSFLPMLKQATAQLDAADPTKPGEQLYAELEKLLAGVTVKLEASVVNVNVSVKNETVAKIATLIEPLVKKARDEAKAMQALNNLRQIAIAMLNYESAHKSFPAAVILGPDGKTPHSWRVAILPYIEYSELYKEYNLNEPWDSENNKKVLAKMPAVYRSPNQDPQSTSSSYYLLTNPKALFTAEAAASGAKIKTITDGTSNTILAIEAERNIPWTKPEDIPVEEGKPRPPLGSKGSAAISAVFADGAAHRLDPKMDDETFWSIVTKNGGEITDMQKAQGEFGREPRGVGPRGFGGETRKAVETPKQKTPATDAVPPLRPVPQDTKVK